ncbi:NEDD8-activating enzyme E1 regulatory subunit [[Candida] railenensis]|uniref:NEDD8-activating enzyme E1 regulatory subunit n=1 Tax=[Candida] railenensis TaxID=45579 RepID=A0A9P0QLT8_9ASCO|nr:NEDD8-activating enzyme E1 regulatory subunit [[Candida] railenensis]
MTSKELKYDRQLRLWANSGQSNLESSHVCLINASTSGSEALKNLILPGIGSFTIVDDHLVTDDDISSGFFLNEDDLGKPIAPAMTSKLQELNRDVKGNSVERSVERLVQDVGVNGQFWSQFNVVILTKRHYTSNNTVGRLKEILWDLNIPLLLVDNIGFYGYLHVIAKEINVIETHPEFLIDLRLDDPWPELTSHVNSINLDNLDDTDHAHVPYVVILIKALQTWKSEHQNLPPQTYAQKKQFKAEYVQALSRDMMNEVNFEEASSNAWRASQTSSIPEHIEEILTTVSSMPPATYLSSTFWLFIKALQGFLANNHGKLPLSGVLPDMTADTPNYISIQNIYRDKARRDQQLFANEINSILATSQSETDLLVSVPSLVPSESIQSFCKNCRFLYTTKGSKQNFNKDMEESLNNSSEDNSVLPIYFAMLAFNDFKEKFNHDPTLDDLQMIAASVDNQIYKKTLKEILIHHSKQYHNVASFMGGIVGQETLKLVTRQYKALDNLFVYDGVHSVSEKWKI